MQVFPGGDNMQPIYKNVLIKLSGEALSGFESSSGFDDKTITMVCRQIAEAWRAGVKISLVTGAGNIWRGGDEGKKLGLDGARADYIGMLGTTINALVVQDKLLSLGCSVNVFSPIGMNHIAKQYDIFEARKSLEDGSINIFAAGSGMPFFTTDTPAALRAVEMGCDALLMAKNVDRLYDRDPKEPGAQPIERITHTEVIRRDLAAFDLTASMVCRKANLKMIMFPLKGEGDIIAALEGRLVGTYIANEI